MRLRLTPDRTPFLAGMMMYASTFHIPPGQKSTLVANRCCMGGFQPAHGFAFRVHTHQLGRNVYQDRHVLYIVLHHKISDQMPRHDDCAIHSSVICIPSLAINVQTTSRPCFLKPVPLLKG